ncbi:uncharacterized protein Dwil_GK14035 [Drosophila willistoni]|uniref:Calponin-homology (CH) domain-containing protein n=1 Tax=Drosophila willistoni TaxID=7260 RepID=B4NL42_DROWI|nr:protein abnormal spindle [Drosophila willistoni]EDW84245.1 uncharacterized protein Dwil_GK14035 [Drosophila willistoni]
MSAFQITVTPRTKQRKRMEGREPTEVVMAPFSAKSIVQFEDVPITKTARRILRIINTSEEAIEVKVSKAIKEEHNVTMEWLEHTVPALEEVSMELVWSPQVETACKETIQLLDNRNFRKDIMVILKSINNQPAKNTRKFPTVGKTLQLKSPTGNIAKIGKVAAAAGQPKKRLSSGVAASAKPQWRASSACSRPRTAPVTEAKTAPEFAPLCDFNLIKPIEEACYISPKSHQGDSKENVSPMTPAHVLNMIDKLKFTPLNDTNGPGSIAKVMPDNLAAWPTPILQSHEQLTISITEMKPRRLTSLELEDQPINNTTFDVKHSETINLSVDTADSSHSELMQLQTPTRAMMNRTTTIVHATQQRVLECIREEETFAEKSPVKSRPQDLKRDIKLIGSPLRKYSESMKDLSLVSSQTKFAIQGSMPNLNEMQQIRSIEQNRYYQEQQVQLKAQKTTKKQDLDASTSSEVSFVGGQQDLHFNHNEILAQSSRFNLHEIGRKAKANAQKRRSDELSFSDSYSNESLHGVATIGTVITPPKKLRVDERIRNAAIPANASAVSTKSWTPTQPKKYKLAQTLSLMKKPQTPRKVKSPIKLYDSELHMQTYINPDPFAATTTTDPFMASTMYLDEKAVERHEIDFKKWLNALVSIPADLDGDTNSKIDVGKLFNEVRNKELVVAPTKEQQSVNYLTTFRLETLRRAAVELFFSKEMCQPCSQVAVYIGKRSLRIRSDRNLHLDVVMQRTILELLLCFNPVWLRLGLEVVFGEKIQMQSNRDMVSLSSFILNRLFRNKLEERKYSKAYTLTEEYAETIKRHTLQKMLFLLLFLDQAKEKRIVMHNPCLFVKKSPHKETKDILLRFASELLANIGDITRELRRLGYVLQHKQTFLDEFNYAFTNIAIDLRDGVRLTRVMEIILLRDDLTRQLRVPAISRLQRVYNVKLALGALSSADFQLGGDISAPDIVDGHREKTLSLLWQIIYKFRSPKFHAAARIIQLWWRRRWLYVIIQRRIREKELRRRHVAATRIQAVFRGYQTRKSTKIYREERIQAAIILQKCTRRYLAQKQLYMKYRSIVHIQTWWRAQRLGRIQRKRFLEQRQAAIFIQRIWRRRLFANKLLDAAATLRLQYSQKIQAAAAHIQTTWRNYCLMKIQRQSYLKQRKLIIYVQQRVRATWLMREQRKEFLQLQQSALCIQQHWRSNILMRKERSRYQLIRSSALKLQQHWRGFVLKRSLRKDFLIIKQSTITIQQHWRATIKMRRQREDFLKLRQSSIQIQRFYRGRLEMLRLRIDFLKTRQSAINIQCRWRAMLRMRQYRSKYVQLVSSVRLVQIRFRAKHQMLRQRQQYLQLKRAAVVLQQRWRARQLMRKERKEFLQLQTVTLNMQRRFRATKAMRFMRAKYRGTRAAVNCLQMHWRGHLMRQRERGHFLALRKAAITLQRHYRARLAMLRQRKSYELLRHTVIQMQARYRAKLKMRQQRCLYQKQRELIIYVQQRFSATIKMRKQRFIYQSQQKAVTRLQDWWRGLREMKRLRLDFKRLQQATLTVQKRWRAILEGRRQRVIYMATVNKLRLLQCRVRATLLMRRQRQQFQRQRLAAITLQRRFRARQLMIKERNDYVQLKRGVLLVQRKFQATRLMRQERQQFVHLRGIVIHIQQKFRGGRLMLEQRKHFQLLRSSTLIFQASVRGYLARKRFQKLMTPEMMEEIRRKRAARTIQRYWRGYCARRKHGKKLVDIRKRLQQLRREALVANSVRCRVEDSVRFLRGRFIASDALAVLTRLDNLSRHVPHLLMWCSEFMATFCYGIMAQAIRSEVDKLLIERCSRIILNLARYNSTTVNTFQEGGLVTVAQMLLRWCDKDCEIFNTLCTLIWVFAHCPRKRRIIHNYMNNTDAIYMIRETKKLVARKEKMKENTRKYQPQSSSLGRHPNRQARTFQPCALPSREPDFGVIRSSPYVFQSSVFAFDTILLKLGIDMC